MTSCAWNQTREARAILLAQHGLRDLARFRQGRQTMFDGTSIAGEMEKSRRLGRPRGRQVRNSQRGSSRPGPKCDKSSVGEDMTRHARPSTVGDIEQQRRIDLAAAYRLLCRFNLNDSIDSHISVSLPGPQDLFFEPIRSGCGWSGNRLQSHHSRYQLRQFR